MTGKTFRIYRCCFLVLFIASTGLSCMSSSLMWVTTALENSFVELTYDDTALVRSIYCDVYLEPVDEKKWKKLLGFNPYAQGNPRLMSYDIPPLEFMHFVVTNTSEEPLIIDNAFIEAGGEEKRSFTAEEIRKRYPYKRYGIFNYENLFAMRRLTGEKKDIMSIDYSKQTLDYRFDFIAPGDTVVLVRAFDWVSLSYEKFSVALVVQSLRGKRGITFNLTRKQYRKGGADFRAPERREYDDI